MEVGAFQVSTNVPSDPPATNATEVGAVGGAVTVILLVVGLLPAYPESAVHGTVSVN